MQLIKTGQIVQGKNSRYKIIQTLSASENQVVYRCQGENGAIYQLNHYQTGCPMLGEPRKRFLGLPQLTGIRKPVDSSKDPSMEFDVFAEAGNDIASHNIGMPELIRYVIPQLNTGLAQIHRYGLLLRDLDPSAILFDLAGKKAFFSQFSNVACINGGATATKAACKGMKPFYYPPEYQTMGWSIYSDYYALGVALLISVKGEKIFAGMTPQNILQRASKWELPEIRRNEFSGTPYNLLSLDQKFMYLIAGLTIPDPHKRWGYGEVRCWCAGQDLPLLQTGRKVRYQMTVPISVNGTRCWDYDQLGEELLRGGKASEQILPAVAKHVSAQYKKAGDRLSQILTDSGLSSQGKVFYMGYTLYPGASGFWWNGKNMHTTEEIATFSSSENNHHQMISQMLKDHCFTFLMKLRGVKTPEEQKKYAIFGQLEQWEAEENGKGAARFVMQMGGRQGKHFQVQGTSYDSVKAFLQAYERKPDELKKISGQLLKNKVFQGIAWSKGFGDMADAAAGQAAHQDEEQNFYTLLLLLEKTGTEEEKRLCRRIWLKYGPCAHITWLHNNLNRYHNAMGHEMGFVKQLRSDEWSEKTSLEELNQKISFMESAYQNFVRNTENNAINLHCGIPIEKPQMIQPENADACFCCKHGQLEVTPAYLREMGLSTQTKEIKTWCEGNLEEARKWLNTEIGKINQVPGYAGQKKSTGEGGTAAGLILWTFVMFFVNLAAYRYQYVYAAAPYLPYVYFVCTMAFSVAGFLWCYSHKMVRAQKGRQIDVLSQKKQQLQNCQKEAEQFVSRIISELDRGRGVPISVKKPVEGFAEGSYIVEEEQQMNSASCKISYVISTTAAVLVLMTGQDMESFGVLSAVLYCAGISAYLGMINKLTCKRAFLIFGYEFLMLVIVFSLMHDYFLIGGIIVLIFMYEILFG